MTHPITCFFSLVALGTVAALFAAPAFGQSSAVVSQTALVDNRFVVFSLATAPKEYSNRPYQAQDYQLNTIIHFNTRLATYQGFYTGSNRGTTAPPKQAPTLPPPATPTPIPTPAPPGAPSGPTATPASKKPNPEPKTAKANVSHGNHH